MNNNMVDEYINRPDLKFQHYLQKKFKNEFFNNISISKIIAASVSQSYLSFERKKFKALKEFLKIIYLLFFRDIYLYLKYCAKIVEPAFMQNKIIIEAISDQARLRGFWLTSAKAYKKNEFYILTEDLKIYNKYRLKYNIIIPYKFNLILWIKSRFYIILNFTNYYKLIKVQDDSFNHLSFKLRLLFDIINQINNSIKSDYFIKKYTPSCFLTFWDLYPFGAVYCNSFRKFNLPSITFIHGAIGVKSLVEFLPLNADYIISWGKHNTNLLKSNGVKMKNILECGCPRMIEYLGPDIDQIKNDKNKFKINSEKKVICFLNTGIIRAEWINDIEKIIKKFSNKYELICRPHPSNNANYISKYFPKNLKIFFDNDISLERTISMSDYFITDSSSAGFDAIFMKKIVFLVDSNDADVYQDIMYDAYKANAVLFSKSVEDFLIQFDNVVNNYDFRYEILKNQALFITDYVSLYSEKSAVSIRKSIHEIISLS